jgi:hypothetical protein
MVAITVVLAAVVFVLVSNLSKTSDKSEEAAVTSRSPSTGILEITLVKEGDHAPYSLDLADASQPNYATISINGELCSFPAGVAENGITAPAGLDWSAGGVVRINDAGTGTGCVDQVVAGNSVSVTVSVAGTLIQSTTVDIRN